MIKNREEVEKEFDDAIGGLHHNDDSYATDHVHLRISKIRKDDIDGLVEELQKVLWNPRKRNDCREHIWSLYCTCDGCAKNTEIKNIIDSLKEKV
jgi:hypothetical protein